MSAHPLRLLVDMSLGRTLEDFIRTTQHDAAFVRDIDIRLPDSTILQLAAQQNRLVVTMDKDFGELVYRSGRRHRGVLLLRLEDQSASVSVPILKEILQNHSARIDSHFSVYQAGRLRIRD